MAIDEQLRFIEQRVARMAKRAGRDPDSIQLIAVSKTRTVEEIEAAYRAGVRHFGENRVQEALAKFPPLRTRYPDLRLHLIGALQTNKVKSILGEVTAIHSLDRPKLADALARQADALGSCPDLFVQVNSGEEPQKAGVLPADLDALVAYARQLGLPLTGLMCIPPSAEAPAAHFAFLAQRAAALGLSELSMGMSQDYEAAVELGATQVRVGSLLFGERGEG